MATSWSCIKHYNTYLAELADSTLNSTLSSKGKLVAVADTSRGTDISDTPNGRTKMYGTRLGELLPSLIRSLRSAPPREVV